MSTEDINLIHADWPLSHRVNAFTTTRRGGVSQGDFQSLNLAGHVGDNPQHVSKNRQLLKQQFALPQHPLWLKQTHSTQLVSADKYQHLNADAIISQQRNTICGVLTADCLPILICNKQENSIAAVHAGWRGLAAGIIENTIDAMNQKPEELIVWIGPAIGKNVFEVGDDVRDAFMRRSTKSASAFIQIDEQKYLADMVMLAKLQLKSHGVEAVYGGDYCSYENEAGFFSFRRDGQTGRMASLIWLEE